MKDIRGIRASLGAKLFGAFAVVVLLLAGMAYSALSSASTLNGKVSWIGNADLPAVETIGQVRALVTDYRLGDYQLLAAATPTERRSAIAARTADAAGIAARLKAYAPVVADDHDRGLLQTVGRQWNAYVAGSSKLPSLLASGRQVEAEHLLDGDAGNYRQLTATMKSWASYNHDFAGADVRGAADTYSSSRTTLIGISLVAALVALAAALLITRSIVGRVRRMLRAAERIGEGDLTVDLGDVRGKDEIGQLSGALQRMRDNLRDAIGQVSQTSTELSVASQRMAATSEEAGRAVGEIAHAVSEVASGAERQVRMVNEARSSTEEVARAVQETAGNARATAQAAEEARTAAHDGVAAADHATEAMQAVRGSTQAATAAIQALEAKSGRIGSFVDTITGIAGQTNLLALNAAIEAARAGEQGKGFAVVAEEVRKLAEESQAAATQVAELVGEIQTETQRAVTVVEDGSRRTDAGAATVEQTREAFLAIGRAVDDVSTRVEQIAAAAQQIAAGAGKVQEGIGEVAAVAEESSASSEQVSASTEETSASTQEIAAAAQQLAGTAEELERLVGRFTLSG
jgi:methyl-accepting chemotaxis protein